MLCVCVCVRLDQLKKDIEGQLSVKVTHQLVFSPASPYFISPDSALSPAHFTELMEQCGASRGNGTLFLLPTAALERSEGCDLSCLAQLSEGHTHTHTHTLVPKFSLLSGFAVSDQQQCVDLITDVSMM